VPAYEAVLSLRMRFDETVSADDLDITSFEHISSAIKDTTELLLAKIFVETTFEPATSLDGRSAWPLAARRKQRTLVELLTPSLMSKRRRTP